VFQWLYSEIADLLEIEGDNPFRIRAYRNGARTLRSLGPRRVHALYHELDIHRSIF
jgi:DNA polymerase (family 10)